MNNKLYKLMNWPEIEEIVYSDGDDPHRILGAHQVGTSLLIQHFCPDASAVKVHFDDSNKDFVMEEADEAGFFAVLVPKKYGTDYKYIITDGAGKEKAEYDAYNFAQVIDREDCIKFNSGIHYDVYNKLGAHVMERDGILGVNFATWAPDAARVSVIGNFNNWDGRIHQMKRIEATGIFEIFIPDVKDGDEYQFEIKNRGAVVYRRPDPYGFRSRDMAGDVSIVSNIGAISWEDSAWMNKRKKTDKHNMPLSICEISLDSFAEDALKAKESVNYRHLAVLVSDYCLENGFESIELMPVMEHDDEHIYDIKGFYALKSEYGNSQDFMFFVNELHKKNIRVIIDFEATFFTKHACGLSMYDGKSLYEYGNPLKAIQPGTERLIFDYGRKQVTNFLLANAYFWLNEFHIDGLRLTDISKILYLDFDRTPGEWTPNIYGSNENIEAEDFLKQLSGLINSKYPGALLITKETACFPMITEKVEDGGLGFDYKWNNGWTSGIKDYMSVDPLFRGGKHNELTGSLIYSFSEKFILAFSHEDVGNYESLCDMVPGDEKAKHATIRMAISYLFTHPGKKMMFHKNIIADETMELQMSHLMVDLNDIYSKNKALYMLDDSSDGFEWIDCMDSTNCTLSFLRKTGNVKEDILVVMNMSGIEREMNVGVPNDGRYQEIFNSDDKSYGGEGIGAGDLKIESSLHECDGRAFSISVKLAPLSLCIFSYIPYTEKEIQIRKIKKQAEIKKVKEQETKRKALISKQEKEEAMLLEKLKKKYEKELAQQETAIEEKYEKFEEERIKDIKANWTTK